MEDFLVFMRDSRLFRFPHTVGPKHSCKDLIHSLMLLKWGCFLSQ